ncbi:MAG: SAM-dependent methyltransferase [Candidatus Nephthysia bennettiae]|nr:MAG: SAM-dependent methyltransferase [Candidatus Dormibacteraeota bacterium]
MDRTSADEGAAVKLRAQASFARSADRYVESATLAEGAELERMLELARMTGSERVLDVATGGGHTALAFAPHAREVVATDLTPAMLAAAARHLARKGASNVRFQVADAEELPFQDAQFDVVTARFAPHHFPQPRAFVAESARVLRPGGRLIIFDNVAPEDEELDAFVNRLEAWRDPSHVRSHRSSEWQSMLTAAGLDIDAADPLVRKLYPYPDWTARQSMPPEERDALEGWLLKAPPRCAEYFCVVVEQGRVTSLEATFGLVAGSVTVAHSQ